MLPHSDTLPLWQTRPASGADLRDIAIQKHERHRADILLAARRAMLEHLLQHGQCTADDVQELCPPPDWIDPVVYGAVPSPLARAGIIRRVGYVPSRRPSAHSRPVSVWRLVDAESAARWLREHPLPAGAEQ